MTVPPRRCRHLEFSSSLTSSLGSGHHFFVALFHRDGGPSVPQESRALPAAAPRGHLLRAARRAAAVSTPLPGPPPLAYSFAPPLSGRATHLYLAWLHWDELPTSMLPGLVKTSLLVPTPSLHQRTVAGVLAN